LSIDDITGIQESDSDMLNLIRCWKSGLKQKIVDKAFNKLGRQVSEKLNFTENIISIIANVIGKEHKSAINQEKTPLL